MFGRLRFIWKFSLLSVLIPLTALVTAAVGLWGAGSLKSQYDNLYTFMLIPIDQVHTANERLDDVILDINALRSPETAGQQRAALIDDLQTKDRQMKDILTRYRNEWLSSLSPDFTETLVTLGKTSLQTDESQALAGYEAAYQQYSRERDALAAGQAVDEKSLTGAMETMSASMVKLINVNMQFADLSNTSAQMTISQMRLELILAGIVISAFGLVFAYLLSRSVVVPMGVITQAAQKMAVGSLNQNTPEAVKQKVSHLKDEVGDVSRSMTQIRVYLSDMAGVAQRIAQGDLTVQVTPRSAEDELGNAFAEMIVRLREMVAQIAENAAHLGNASNQLAQAANQAGQATGQIATTIQQVARGTTEQTESVTRTVASVEEMNQAIERVAQGAQHQSVAVEKSADVTGKITASIQAVTENAQAGVQGSERAARVAQSGAEKVTATVRGMEVIREKVGLSAGKVREMGQRSNQIGVIIETIEDIASQTNMLALNAAIEAARAGEEGRGFAVVADEVRKLAERASSATKEIAGLVKSIQSTVSDAVTAMDEGASEVEQGVVRANESGQALSSVLEAVQDVSRQVLTIAQEAQQMSRLSDELVAASDAVGEVVQENTATTEEMTAGSSEVGRAIESIAAVGEENSASVEEVSASAEEMSAQVEEVAASAMRLAEIGEELQNVVAQFKIPGNQSVIVDPAERPNGSNGRHYGSIRARMGAR